jgi:nucleoid DNA-binding protein
MPNNALNKAGLVETLHSRNPEWTKRELQSVVDDLLDVVVERVAAGDEIRLSGFGKFHAVTRAPRQGRNPRTGHPVPIPETTVPQFKPGKLFRAEVEES